MKKNEYDGQEIWHVADIYPVYKVINMVYILLLIRPNFREYTYEEYMSLVASYMIYAHLIHSVQRK